MTVTYTGRRFPQKMYDQIEANKQKVESGEITQEQYDAWFFRKADFYDNIKKGERWWENEVVVYDMDPIEIQEANARRH